jgi:hypothetical protein
MQNTLLIVVLALWAFSGLAAIAYDRVERRRRERLTKKVLAIIGGIEALR